MTDRSPEDIAYVEEVCRQIRANLKAETERVARTALAAKPVYVVVSDKQWQFIRFHPGDDNGELG